MEAGTVVAEGVVMIREGPAGAQTFALNAGQTLNHIFPAGFHAHWVRVRSSAATTATAQFTYGPADTRDAFLDWARDPGLPTGSGRAALEAGDGDKDGLANLVEFLTGGRPTAFDPNPIVFTGNDAHIVLRDSSPSDEILTKLEFSSSLDAWETRPTEVLPAADQRSVPAGFTRYRMVPHPQETRLFLRLKAE